MGSIRTLTRHFMLMVAILPLLAFRVHGEEVQWLRSAEQAASVAAKTGKPILVYVRSASCHYCDLMQQNVWQDPATVTQVMRDFVPLKLTREENAEAVEALQIKGFPSTLVFSADRKYMDRIDGYVEAERFQSVIHKLKLASSRSPTTPVQR